MTIGIALKDRKNNQIIIGTDRQETLGEDIISVTHDKKFVCKELKIVDGYCNHIDTHEIYFIFAGWGFLKGFMKHTFEIPDMNENQDFIEYLYNNLLECFRQQLLDKKLLGTSNDKFRSESNVIIVYDGEIYELDSNFGVNQVKEFVAIGSGWKVAIGSLYTNLHFHSYLDAAEMVREAVIACGVNTMYCDTNVDLEIIKI